MTIYDQRIVQIQYVKSTTKLACCAFSPYFYDLTTYSGHKVSPGMLYGASLGISESVSYVLQGSLSGDRSLYQDKYVELDTDNS